MSGYRCALGLGFAFLAVQFAHGRDGVYVPLDSWVYPTLYRLSALGFVPDQFSNMAPWTREECARQVTEAAAVLHQHGVDDKIDGTDAEAQRLITDLKAELNDKLAADGGAIRFESAYTNLTGVAGTPLTDSYHFGQTVVNNYGRPYARGVSNDTGLSAYANFGRFFAYARGEYQGAPGVAAESLSTREFVAAADSNPLLPGSNGAATHRFEPEEMYVGMQLGPENISFGRENLWWGPGQDSSFAFSDNAGPFYMLNFNQTTPVRLPSVFRYLGRMRTQFIFGELSGHAWPRAPQVNAQKVTFEITDNLEMGIIRSAFWGGAGHPVTLGSFGRSLFASSSTGCSFGYADRCDPGDRHSGFDIRWRVKGIEKYLTLYTDSYADDEVNPLANPKRSAWAPGVYLSHVPHFSKMDVRFETYATWLNTARDGQFFYYNNQYHDSYTNDGSLLGSYVGRQARALVGTAGYWFSGRTRLQAQFRHVSEPATYLPGGGTQTNASLMAQWSARRDLLVDINAQAEQYNIPVLGAARKDLLVSGSILLTPENWVTSKK